MSGQSSSTRSTSLWLTVGTLCAAIVGAVKSDDPYVRHVAVWGVVMLPAVWVVCSMLVKRARARAAAPSSPLGPLGDLVSTFLGPKAAPPREAPRLTPVPPPPPDPSDG